VRAAVKVGDSVTVRLLERDQTLSINMQNFGLDFVRMQQLNAVEQEIAGEQAAALGMTGKRLRSA
jgi:hypothetical protein